MSKSKKKRARGSVWRHRKNGSGLGMYKRYGGERNFVIWGQKRKRTFESWQAAFDAGWRRDK